MQGRADAGAGHDRDGFDHLAACDQLLVAVRGETQAQERAARGLQAYDRTPPPIVYPGEELGAATRCAEGKPPAYDLSGCREADVQTGNTSTRVWVCPSAG